MKSKKSDVDKVDETFISENEGIKRKLTLLGYSLTQAVAEDETKLAETIIEEAKQIKKDAERI